MNNKQFGLNGEELACEYLRTIGYSIVVRNFHNKHGEIDIVANHNGRYIFIEVKTRQNKAYGRPAEAVTHNKQHKLIKMALYFLKYYHLKDVKCRFDVIEVYYGNCEQAKINHIKGAFTA